MQQRTLMRKEMTQEYKKQLIEAGVNLDSALDRFMNDENLFENFLKKFPEDKTFDCLKDNLKENHLQDAFMAAHTLKGICSNFELSSLVEILTPLTEKLRLQETDDMTILVTQLEEHYLRLCQIINDYK